MRSFSLLFISIVGFFKNGKEPIFSSSLTARGVCGSYRAAAFYQRLWLPGGYCPHWYCTQAPPFTLRPCERMCFFTSASRSWVLRPAPTGTHGLWRNHGLLPFLFRFPSIRLLLSRWTTLRPYVQISTIKPICLPQKNPKSLISYPTSVLFSDALGFSLLLRASLVQHQTSMSF